MCTFATPTVTASKFCRRRFKIIDLDDEPQRWHSGNRFTWDLPPPKKWLYQATPFQGAPVVEPKAVQKLFSLEDFLDTVT